MGTRGRLRDARTSLSLYSNVYGAVAPRGSRDVPIATPSLTKLAREVES
jgi:hypothetical protein